MALNTIISVGYIDGLMSQTYTYFEDSVRLAEKVETGVQLRQNLRNFELSLENFFQTD